MITITSQNGDIRYNVVEFVLDTINDIPNLPTDVSAGSTAFVISTGDCYMFNSEGSWVKL